MSRSPRRLLSDDGAPALAAPRPDGASPFAIACRPGGGLVRPSEAHRPLGPGRDEPSAIGKATDVTVPAHGETRGIGPGEIEARRDSIGTVEGRTARAERTANWFFRCRENPSIMARACWISRLAGEGHRAACAVVLW